MSFARADSPKKIIALSIVLAVVAVLGWLTVWQPKVEDRTYRIGFENSPPIHFMGKDGGPTGLAVELVSEAARRLGYPSPVARGSGKFGGFPQGQEGGFMADDDHPARAKRSRVYHGALC